MEEPTSHLKFFPSKADGVEFFETIGWEKIFFFVGANTFSQKICLKTDAIWAIKNVVYNCRTSSIFPTFREMILVLPPTHPFTNKAMKRRFFLSHTISNYGMKFLPKFLPVTRNIFL